MFTYDIHPQKTVKPFAFSGNIQSKQTAVNSLFISADKQVLQFKSENNTDLHDVLKARIENGLGISLDNIKAHHNSSRPAQLQAFSYTQGTDARVAPTQEKHLPHEADVMGRKSMTPPCTRKIHNTGIRSSVVQCSSDWKTPSLEEQSKSINSENSDHLQRVIHHMLPRKLLEDFCLRLNEAQQQKIKETFALNIRDKSSTPHRILKSLHSNLVVGPEVSSRLDDEDHLKGPRGEQQYFFDATGGIYTEVSAIYREIFEKMNLVVNCPCPQESFEEIMKLLQQAEEKYRKMSRCDEKDDFNPEILKARSAEIWRKVELQDKPYYVKRSDKYIITVKKTLPYFMNAVRDKMRSLGYESVCNYETNILTCTKKVEDRELNQNMEQLREMYDKKDTLSIQGILS